MKRLVVFAPLFLAGCDNTASFAFSDPATENETGTVSLSVTDAPVDGVDEVRVVFAGITLQGPQVDPVTLPLASTEAIDLLRLQGGTTAPLVAATEVPTGNYTSFRLVVNAAFDSVFDSYVVRDGGQIEIEVPGGGQVDVSGGLGLSANQSLDIVIDWDLRQSLTEPAGQPGFVLQPQLRLLDTANSGSMAGSVSDLLIDDTLNGAATCDNDLAADTGTAVYLYSDVVEAPNDIQPADVSPLTTATVQFDGTAYRYSVGFLEVGSYTVALTCQGLADSPETDDDIEFASIITGVTVTAGQATTQDFADR